VEKIKILLLMSRNTTKQTCEKSTQESKSKTKWGTKEIRKIENLIRADNLNVSEEIKNQRNHLFAVIEAVKRDGVSKQSLQNLKQLLATDERFKDSIYENRFTVETLHFKVGVNSNSTKDIMRHTNAMEKSRIQNKKNIDKLNLAKSKSAESSFEQISDAEVYSTYSFMDLIKHLNNLRAIVISRGIKREYYHEVLGRWVREFNDHR
jgi:hypothetical protein